jgi:hypothetical protein
MQIVGLGWYLPMTTDHTSDKAGNFGLWIHGALSAFSTYQSDTSVIRGEADFFKISRSSFSPNNYVVFESLDLHNDYVERYLLRNIIHADFRCTQLPKRRVYRI